MSALTDIATTFCTIDVVDWESPLWKYYSVMKIMFFQWSKRWISMECRIVGFFGAPAYIILGQAIHCAGFTDSDSTQITLVTSYEMLGCFIGTRLMFQILIDLSSPSLICARVKSHYMRNGHPTFNREFLCCVYKPSTIWVDDHPLPWGSNGSLVHQSFRIAKAIPPPSRWLQVG